MDKRFRIIAGEIKSPPMSAEDRREVGLQIRLLQRGNMLSMPVSLPMPAIGARCHELRINDWRIVYRIDDDAIVVLEVFLKDSPEDAEADHRRVQVSDQALRREVKGAGRMNNKKARRLAEMGG
jgi:phage-related protein